MSPELFDQLCSVIIDIVGEEEFKSEDYLNFCTDDNDSNPSHNIAKAHAKSTGGFISGEVKLAMTLRILGGGSFMDIAMLFGNSFNHAHKIVGHVVENWLLHPRFYPIDGIAYCRDESMMREVASQFHIASQGVMTGCIGALDGWVVKIKPPSVQDGVRDPASFYSRKGFYGLNVQAIVDKKKRVLYRSILSRGAEHDSTAFKNSSLYGWLSVHWKRLCEKGYYFIGDSAYALRSFIHTPYDNALHDTPEDNYNFFHSSSRISVECAFGEIVHSVRSTCDGAFFGVHFNILCGETYKLSTRACAFTTSLLTIVHLVEQQLLTTLIEMCLMMNAGVFFMQTRQTKVSTEENQTFVSMLKEIVCVVVVRPGSKYNWQRWERIGGMSIVTRLNVRVCHVLARIGTAIGIV